MNRTKLILVTILFAVVAESRGQRQAVNNDFIKVDVTKTNYPKKELILQDFMDVEYIPLETNNDFLNQGVVMDIGKEFILVKNRNQDGDIFVYDRTGKALRKINRKGQGGEEYILIVSITLDEDNKEMFINDALSHKILVYDLYGKFKRKINTNKKEKVLTYYKEIFNYDKDNLICYDNASSSKIPFVLISKQDGSITKEIEIPFEERKSLSAPTNKEVGLVAVPTPFYSIIPNNENLPLSEISSDIVYTFLPDYNLRPYIERTPSVQSMNPEVCLIVRFISNRYIFMETIKNDYDWNTRSGFPSTFMMYDRQEKAFGRYAVYNGDYSTKKEIYMSRMTPVSHEILSWYSYEAYQLVESYRKGELKDGKLKEIASKLDEEDNPVIMLIKHKK